MTHEERSHNRQLLYVVVAKEARNSGKKEKGVFFKKIGLFLSSISLFSP